MEQISRIGMDTSKHVFQVHGVDGSEQPVLTRKLKRDAMVAFFGTLAPTVVAIEACGAAHHWARTLGAMGHTVKLIAPQLAKPYVKRGKNDAADAAALCEAMSRPTMRFVPTKTADQQAALMLASARERLVRARTQLANTIRGHAAEFGLAANTGLAHVAPLLARIAADTSGPACMPALARALFADLACEFAQIDARVAAADARLRAWHRASEASQRLAKVPGIGPVTASLLVMKVADPKAFKTGRDFAAWLGLTPRDHSTAGKVRAGGITRAGDEGLRSLLVVGATSVIRQVRITADRPKAVPPAPSQPAPGASWLERLLARKAPKLAAVAQANKTARIAWRLLASGADYNPTHGQPKPLAA